MRRPEVACGEVQMGGADWTKVLTPGVQAGCLDLAIRTDQTNDYVFASCGSRYPDTATIYRNTDAGGSGVWTALYSEASMGRTSLALAPSNQNVVYALAADHDNHGLLAVVRSTDSGNTWSSRVRNTDPTKLNTVLLTNPAFAFYADCSFIPPGPNQFFNQGWYDNVVAVDPLDQNRVWAGGIDLFRSDDGGANWGLASYWWAPSGHSHFAHADQHAILFHPDYNGGSNKIMFVANDGGIFRTDNARAATATGSTAPCSVDNGSVTWTSLNNGYGVTQFYHGLPYPNGATYFGGTQDNGTLRGSDSGGINGWSRPLGGDGGYVAVDPTDTAILFAENTQLSFQKSADGGANWFPATSGITDSSNSFLRISPFTMDPSNSQRLWLGGGNTIWRTTNGAGSWLPASHPLDVGEAVSAIAVASTNPNKVLAGTQLGRIYRTDSGLTSNADTVWSSITLRNLGDYISWISVDPNDPNIAYTTVSTFNAFSGDHHVFKSTNGGASWVNIDGSGSTGIPDIPVHCIVVDPNNSSKLYVGTDLGVFVSLDGGVTWNRENTGFANAVTESLAFNTTGGTTTLFAFTHGRGVWRVPVSTAPPPPPPSDPKITAVSATASATSPGFTPNAVIDGNLNSNWSAGDYAPQWIEIDLGQNYSISKIRLNPSQSPAGNTIHQVYMGSQPQPGLLVTTLNQFTQDHQFFEQTFSPTIGLVRYVKVLTTSSPSWISWFEIELYGTPSSGSPDPKINAVSATASATSPGFTANAVIDGNLNSNWSAGDYAPQWIEIDLGQNYSISKIRLNPSQSPAGNTIHQVYMGSQPQPGLLVATFNQFTQDHQWFEQSFSLTISPVRYVKVLTTSSPSWISWFEIELYGTPSSGPTDIKIIAVSATASATSPGFTPSAVIDGDLNVNWSAGASAPQWVQIDLGQNYSISRIKLNTSQSPSGNTIHQIYMGLQPQPTMLVTTFSQFTLDRQWLEQPFSPAISNVRYVKVLTTSSPSWVSWFEIEVYRPQ